VLLEIKIICATTNQNFYRHNRTLSVAQALQSGLVSKRVLATLHDKSEGRVDVLSGLLLLGVSKIH
jgi:hypothetical protein